MEKYNSILLINIEDFYNYPKEKTIVIKNNINTENIDFNIIVGDIIIEINKLKNIYFDYIEIDSNNYKELYILIYSLRRLINNNTIIKINNCEYINNVLSAHFDKIELIQNNPIIIKYNDNYINNYKNIKKPTIVTGFFYIRRFENEKDWEERSVEKFIEWGKNYKYIDAPIIIYTDSYCGELMKNEFKNNSNIKIIILDFFKTYFYKYKDIIDELQKKFIVYDRQIEKDTPLYVIVNNNKFHCIEDAINNNYFDSDKFVWIDFGISSRSNLEFVNTWIKDVPDKIRQMLITPNYFNIFDKEVHHTSYHFIGGGVFSGHKDYLLKYSELFKKRFEKTISEEWWQQDEVNMALVYYQNKELFSPFYGDYQDILTNYLDPLNDRTGIVQMSFNRYLNVRRYEDANNVLKFIENYYSNHSNIDYKILYINFNILITYYVNNKNFTYKFIKFVKENKNNSIIINNLKNNIENINYYENKNEIIQLIQ